MQFRKGAIGWRVYVDQTHRFCFQYPTIYKIRRDARRHSTVIELRAEGDILVWFDQRPFGPRRFEELSRSGNPAEPTKIGGLTFYYNGPGGGGVDYSDDYLFNLRGKILHIEFDGPYINDNHPSEETKKLVAHDKLRIALERSRWSDYRNRAGSRVRWNRRFDRGIGHYCERRWDAVERTLVDPFRPLPRMRICFPTLPATGTVSTSGLKSFERRKIVP